TWQPRAITAYSLAVVCANACSGTVAYLRQRRVDRRSALAFALAAIPGVLLGVFGADTIDRGIFDPLFGVLLMLMAAWLAIAPDRRPAGLGGKTTRALVDAHGNRYQWSFRMPLGLAGSIAVGIISALFGIGGGPVQVPFLVAVLNYPEHLATATSHAVLAITSLVATLIHAAQGDYSTDLPLTLATAAGALLGAPLGAKLSRYVPGRILLRILASMLAFIAVRLITPHGGHPSRQLR
ncbi:MAG TPA: sulfite exporter TauE/SafE family protein, partial [Candidatus Acidoferrum sp.]|nr:sulfite exporter TauE/SafE family protein [Candidatus Acidoferrum sp.]